ncbi:MAG: hypothetical protein WC552_07690, partial [Candidatus Omnitrophota bacterium]
MTVDGDDPAFRPGNGSKPVGIKRIDEQGRALPRPKVASPKPIAIVEIDEICRHLADGKIVICVGGGGIPVDHKKWITERKLEPLPAVIDKDLATAVLVKDLTIRGPPALSEAEGCVEGPAAPFKRVIISTEVPCAYLDFNKPNQQEIRTVTTDLLKRYIQEGQFSKGSMLPKIEAAVDMVDSGAALEVIITNPENLADIDNGGICTRVLPGQDPTGKKDGFSGHNNALHDRLGGMAVLGLGTGQSVVGEVIGHQVIGESGTGILGDQGIGASFTTLLSLGSGSSDSLVPGYQITGSPEGFSTLCSVLPSLLIVAALYLIACLFKQPILKFFVGIAPPRAKEPVRKFFNSFLIVDLPALISAVVRKIQKAAPRSVAAVLLPLTVFGLMAGCLLKTSGFQFSKGWFIFALIISVFTVDQTLKAVARARFVKMDDQLESLTTNKFLFINHFHPLHRNISIIVAILLAALVFDFFFSRWAWCSPLFGLAAGGLISNLFDLIRRDGGTNTFAFCKNAFNPADVGILAGVSAVMLSVPFKNTALLLVGTFIAFSIRFLASQRGVHLRYWVKAKLALPRKNGRRADGYPIHIAPEELRTVLRPGSVTFNVELRDKGYDLIGRQGDNVLMPTWRHCRSLAASLIFYVPAELAAALKERLPRWNWTVTSINKILNRGLIAINYPGEIFSHSYYLTLEPPIQKSVLAHEFLGLLTGSHDQAIEIELAYLKAHPEELEELYEALQRLREKLGDKMRGSINYERRIMQLYYNLPQKKAKSIDGETIGSGNLFVDVLLWLRGRKALIRESAAALKISPQQAKGILFALRRLGLVIFHRKWLGVKMTLRLQVENIVPPECLKPVIKVLKEYQDCDDSSTVRADIEKIFLDYESRTGQKIKREEAPSAPREEIPVASKPVVKPQALPAPMKSAGGVAIEEAPAPQPSAEKISMTFIVNAILEGTTELPPCVSRQETEGEILWRVDLGEEVLGGETVLAVKTKIVTAGGTIEQEELTREGYERLGFNSLMSKKYSQKSDPWPLGNEVQQKAERFRVILEEPLRRYILSFQHTFNDEIAGNRLKNLQSLTAELIKILRKFSEKSDIKEELVNILCGADFMFDRYSKNGMRTNALLSSAKDMKRHLESVLEWLVRLSEGRRTTVGRTLIIHFPIAREESPVIAPMPLPAAEDVPQVVAQNMDEDVAQTMDEGAAQNVDEDASPARTENTEGENIPQENPAIAPVSLPAAEDVPVNKPKQALPGKEIARPRVKNPKSAPRKIDTSVKRKPERVSQEKSVSRSKAGKRWPSEHVRPGQVSVKAQPAERIRGLVKQHGSRLSRDQREFLERRFSGPGIVSLEDIAEETGRTVTTWRIFEGLAIRKLERIASGKGEDSADQGRTPQGRRGDPDERNIPEAQSPVEKEKPAEQPEPSAPQKPQQLGGMAVLGVSALGGKSLLIILAAAGLAWVVFSLFKKKILDLPFMRRAPPGLKTFFVRLPSALEIFRNIIKFFAQRDIRNPADKAPFWSPEGSAVAILQLLISRSGLSSYIKRQVNRLSDDLSAHFETVQPVFVISQYYESVLKAWAQRRGLTSFAAYLKFLECPGPDAQEELFSLTEFFRHSLEYYSTGTSFFWYANIYDLELNEYLDDAIRTKRQDKDLTFHVRHVASSSGEEVYTAAVYIYLALQKFYDEIKGQEERLGTFQEWISKWSIETDAFDINPFNLVRVEAGLYEKERVLESLERHFEKKKQDGDFSGDARLEAARIFGLCFEDFDGGRVQKESGLILARLNREIRKIMKIRCVCVNLSEPQQLSLLESKKYDITFSLYTLRSVSNAENVFDAFLRTQRSSHILIYSFFTVWIKDSRMMISPASRIRLENKLIYLKVHNNIPRLALAFGVIDPNVGDEILGREFVHDFFESYSSLVSVEWARQRYLLMKSGGMKAALPAAQDPLSFPPHNPGLPLEPDKITRGKKNTESRFRLPNELLSPLTSQQVDEIRKRVQGAIDEIGIEAIMSMDPYEFGMRIARAFQIGFIDVWRYDTYKRFSHLFVTAGIVSYAEFVQTVRRVAGTIITSHQDERTLKAMPAWMRVLIEKGPYDSYIFLNVDKDRQQRFAYLLTVIHELAEYLVSLSGGVDRDVIATLGHYNMLVLELEADFAHQLGCFNNNFDEKRRVLIYPVGGLSYLRAMEKYKAFVKLMREFSIANFGFERDPFSIEGTDSDPAFIEEIKTGENPFPKRGRLRCVAGDGSSPRPDINIADIGLEAGEHEIVNRRINALKDKGDIDPTINDKSLAGLFKGFEVHVVGDEDDMFLDEQSGQRAHAGGISDISLEDPLANADVDTLVSFLRERNSGFIDEQQIREHFKKDLDVFLPQPRGRLWIARGYWEHEREKAINLLCHERVELLLWSAKTRDLLYHKEIHGPEDYWTSPMPSIREWISRNIERARIWQAWYHAEANMQYPVFDNYVLSPGLSYGRIVTYRPELTAQEIKGAIIVGRDLGMEEVRRLIQAGAVAFLLEEGNTLSQRTISASRRGILWFKIHPSMRARLTEQSEMVADSLYKTVLPKAVYDILRSVQRRFREAQRRLRDLKMK